MRKAKKFFLAAAVAFFGALAFGHNWKHSAGLSLAPAWHSIHVRGEGDKSSFVPQLSARYFGEMDNGFCLTGTVGAGVLASKDFKLDNEGDFAAGPSLGLSFGAGYAFHIGERCTLAALGSLSFDWAQIRKRKELSTITSYGRITGSWTQKDDLLLFGIGAEILGIFKLSDRVSLLCSLAVRYFDAGALIRSGEKQGKSYDDSFEARGNLCVAPSIGAALTF